MDITKEELTLEEQQFVNGPNDGVWIFKPTQLNCGKGIKLVDDIKKFKEDFLRMKNNSSSLKFGKKIESPNFNGSLKKSIIQKYIHNPLLLDKKKFDMRIYVVIACTSPLLVLYHHGYLRLSLQDYVLNDKSTDE